MKFRFDAAGHLYWHGTTPVPAISAILRAQHPTGPWFTPEHLARGSAVHAATLAFDLGASSVQFLTAHLPEAWRPFFAAYVAFRQTVACRWTSLEQPCLSVPYGFAGTPDRDGAINARPANLEIKTGGSAPWHAVQTAAQDVLLSKPNQWGRRDRYVVYLRADGTFRFRRHTSAGDYLNFFTALSAFQRAAQPPLDTNEGRD